MDVYGYSMLWFACGNQKTNCGSLFSPSVRRSFGYNSNHQTQQQVPLPTEPYFSAPRPVLNHGVQTLAQSLPGGHSLSVESSIEITEASVEETQRIRMVSTGIKNILKQNTLVCRNEVSNTEQNGLAPLDLQGKRGFLNVVAILKGSSKGCWDM